MSGDQFNMELTWLSSFKQGVISYCSKFTYAFFENSIHSLYKSLKILVEYQLKKVGQFFNFFFEAAEFKYPEWVKK